MTFHRERATDKYDLPHAFELAVADPKLGVLQCRCARPITDPLHAVEALRAPEAASEYQGFVTEKGI